MTKVDREYIDRVLREARDAVEEIRELTSMSLSEFLRSRTARFSLRYSVIMLVESLADLAVSILEKDFDATAESYREVFLRLAERGVVSGDVALEMAKLASLRNLIVHRYWEVDDARVFKEARRGGVEVVEKFIEEVERYASQDP